MLDQFVDFMRENSHLYPQVATQVQAVIEDTIKIEQVEWTLIQLKLDMSEYGADLEGDLA